MATQKSMTPKGVKGPQIPKDPEFVAARNTYILIFASFLTVIAIAVTVTVWQERHKTGFQAIETTQPLSFFDDTYVDKSDKSGEAAE